MLIDELLTYLFDGQSHLLTGPMGIWFASSRRFTAFVNTNHTKIRKKLRTARDPESLRDLQLELETAYLLLREPSLSVAYEPQHPREGRSPDFAVTFTTSVTFMVEVTRLRASQSETSPDTPLPGDRFSDMLCGKLGQLLPQRSNLLLVGSEAPPPTLPDITPQCSASAGAMTRPCATIWVSRRLDFFHHYQRLSGLLVRGIPMQAGDPVVLWVNPQAKVPLPARLRTAITRSHTL
jgi:hypothetical protein